ncbi:ATP-binding cassette domain-containing protein [Paenibacillus sp. MMS20-IR301]|uniref:ATP-binding cassette domain-containing protein n=1 Tax=Paenibacillus sp. MMS20-IR301 TaxID=2895946 RepID=UPI0028F124B8|nr:ATP-binding cassette domain-containing protein [Paenibacillus sp. MMS20-IR301]WNS42508.1 ATP-binding cassette domain-containing protein [Paenibacillus sp. MMS20-IR301]
MVRIQAEHLFFQYDGGKQVLQDISLNIREGTLNVLCGVNGSGKSTLLRLLAGLERPASGTITFTEVEGTDKRTGAAVSMVFQQPETQLFAGSVHKDVEYGLAEHGVPKAQRSDMIRSALAGTGLPYEEYAGRSPFLLSGGEKRRVCIAGALALQPGLLILDEPTAGLDPQAAQSLLALVQELRGSGLTLIIGTHDLDSFLPVADRVIVMKQGAVHYDGPAPALTADPQLLPDAGLTPPAYASLGSSLLQRGYLHTMPDSLEMLLDSLDKHPLPLPVNGRVQVQVQAEPASADHPDRQESAGADLPSPGAGASARQTAPRWWSWQGLDPRVKWLGMLAGSMTVLGMDTLLPLLLAGGLLAGLGGAAGISRRRALRFFRPFLLMFLFLWLMSALSWSAPDFTVGPLGFSTAGMLSGGISVLRFLLLIALGFLFTETTTGMPLREGLEWGIAPLKALGIKTRNWSLVVSVTLQFIPWIIGKLAQLQLALSSRGRPAHGLRRWSPRQIALLIVPLLILVLGMGDELATAIESRGYDPARQRTPAYQLSWSRRDTLAALIILGTAALLWWIAQLS